MKRTLLIISIALLPALLFAFNPDELNTVEFINETGFDIVYLFFSPADSGYWGPDILGSSRILEDGGSLGFYIHYPDACNDFDFMAVDEDGDAYVLWDQSICDSSPATLRITLDNLDFDVATSMDFVEMNLVSDIDYDIYFAFVSPGDSRMFGVDMLDEDTILHTDEALSLVVPASSDPTRYDIMAVDEDMDTYSFAVELTNAQSEWTWEIEMSDLD